MAQAVGEKAERAVLQDLVEIDQHVAAADHVHLAEDAVGNEVVVGKGDFLF